MLSYHSYHIYSTWKSIQVGGGDLKFEVIVWNGGGAEGGEPQRDWTGKSLYFMQLFLHYSLFVENFIG